MATTSEFLEGFRILARYQPDGDVDANYQALLVDGPPPDQLTEEDRRRLSELGWEWFPRHRCWFRGT